MLIRSPGTVSHVLLSPLTRQYRDNIRHSSPVDTMPENNIYPDQLYIVPVSNTQKLTQANGWLLTHPWLIYRG
jgi:hypothetical protein